VLVLLLTACAHRSHHVIDPKQALDELMFMAQGKPGRIGLLCGCIRSALESPPQAAAHRELFLAVSLLLNDIESRPARERALNAVAALEEHYGIGSPEDLWVMDAGEWCGSEVVAVETG
jgi:hypothetical protein